MILEQLDASPADLHRETGWELKPEGACKNDRCVPLGLDRNAGVPDRFDVRVLADKLGMPIVHDEANGLWALGPESGGHFLDSAALPEITLPDVDGNPFSLSSLRGKKVLLVAWASW